MNDNSETTGSGNKQNLSDDTTNSNNVNERNIGISEESKDVTKGVTAKSNIPRKEYNKKWQQGYRKRVKYEKFQRMKQIEELNAQLAAAESSGSEFQSKQPLEHTLDQVKSQYASLKQELQEVKQEEMQTQNKYIDLLQRSIKTTHRCNELQKENEMKYKEIQELKTVNTRLQSENNTLISANKAREDKEEEMFKVLYSTLPTDTNQTESSRYHIMEIDENTEMKVKEGNHAIADTGTEVSSNLGPTDWTAEDERKRYEMLQDISDFVKQLPEL